MPAHQCWSENDGEIACRHSVLSAILGHSVQMEYQCPECGIVGVGERVDDCVQRVASNDIIFRLRCLNEITVLRRRQQWIRQVTQEMFQQCRDRSDVVVEG